MRLPLLVSCLLSFGMHIGFFLLVPMPPFRPLHSSEPVSNVELVVADLPLPTALQPPPTPAAPSPATPVPPTYDMAKITPADVRQIEGAIEKLSSGTSMQLPLPPLQLPTQQQVEELLEPVSPLPPDFSELTAALLERSAATPGRTTGTDDRIGWGQARLGKKAVPSRLGLPRLDPQLTTAAPSPSPQPLPPPVLPAQLGIQGPAAEREPVYRPPLPKVRVQTDSAITLKFWVRPDGVVSRVLPVRKGDATLEAVAMRYLEEWRFSPLPPHEPQVEQWGTITIRFLVPKR